MMYLLSADEYGNLISEGKQRTADFNIKLQQFCSMVADTIPVKSGWMKGKIWGCILTSEKFTNYCDDCPAVELCPYPDKQWSK